MNDLYDSSDVAMRISSVLYDSFWSMLSSPNAMARKLEKVRRQSGGSVVSDATAFSPSELKDAGTRLDMMQALLSNAPSTISENEYAQIVTTCLKAQDLYPSFKDTFVIVDHLLRTTKNADPQLTPAQMFGFLFRAACDVLTDTNDGVRLLKLVCLPTTTQQPQFRISRNKFCHAFSERCDYIDAALDAMCGGKRDVAQDDDDESEEEQEEEEEEEDNDEVLDAKSANDIDDDVRSVLSRKSTISRTHNDATGRAKLIGDASLKIGVDDDNMSSVSRASKPRAKLDSDTLSTISRSSKTRPPRPTPAEDDVRSIVSKSSRATQTA